MTELSRVPVDAPTLARRPLEVLDQSPMGLRQWLIVAICIGALALDGYDVLSISLAGAGIADEWGLSKAELGFLLPLELLGMALGSIFIGTLSDFWGRRRVMLLCLTIMTLGMAVSAIAGGISVLAVSRIFTGLGIGGVLACATAMSSEVCNAKNRSVAVVLVAGGFSFGVFIASKLAAPILTQHDWRMIFSLGAGISLVFLPVVYFLVPESVGYLERTRPAGAQEKIETILARLGHRAEVRLPDCVEQGRRISPAQLLNRKHGRTTAILIFAYFMNILTYYYFVKWTPPAVVDLGYSQADGSEVLAMVSMGGLAGSVLIAVLSRFVSLKKLMIAALVVSAIAVALFPYAATSLASMMIVGAVAGFALFAVIGGAFGLFAESFPSAILGAGSGLVLGIGRGGAVIGPWGAGLLFSSGLLLTSVSPIMAAGSFLAAIALIFLPKRSELAV